MVAVLDDASTDVDWEVGRFCAAVISQFETTLRTKGATQVPRVQLRIAKEQESRAVRTPRQQAELISKNWSWVCWSAHMSDKARHVEVRVNGTRTWDPRASLGVHFPVFVRIWSEEMRRHKLLNFRSRDGWSDKDWHHLELHAARITRSDPRAQACLAEYVRLTTIEKRPRNAAFESSYKTILAPHLERLDQPQRPTITAPKPVRRPVDSKRAPELVEPSPKMNPLS